jgi:hypothetical protein
VSYRTSRAPDDDLQAKHTELQELMDQTISISEASRLYGVSDDALRNRLARAWRWELKPRISRYRKEDVEEAVMRVRLRSEYKRMKALRHPELPLFEE